MFKVTFLSKENDLNKILRNQKRSRETINILFTSLWDKYSSELLEKIREKYHCGQLPHAAQLCNLRGR